MTMADAHAQLRATAALRGELTHMLIAFGLVLLVLCACLALEQAAMARAGAGPDGRFAAAMLGLLALSAAALVWIGFT